ncbi:MAG: hypothetical protein C5B52_05300 [Bacteroidetes bacterium]|nr:MAG: hypothetical protein C5B52_05300 [Bacteroidota bacterium]
MKRIGLLIVLIVAINYSSWAQSNIFGISWEVNTPTNGHYITKTSYAGGKIEYRHFFQKKYSVGLALNWTNYEQYFPKTTIQSKDGNSAVTSDYVAQVYQLPITATFHYYFTGSKSWLPYAGIALGGQSLQQSLYYNVYVSDDDNWGFVARPEIGVIWHPEGNINWGIMLGASYSYATNKTDLIGSNSFQNFGLSLGFVFGN